MILLWLVTAGFLTAAVRAQQPTTGHASDFTSIEYYQAPHQQQMKSRLSGAEAQPQAGGLLVIQQLKLETFGTNGTAEWVIKAPHCVYDTLHDLASSPGHLLLESADGSSHIEGDGFLFRRGEDSLLTISNNVHTVIQNMQERKTGL